MNQYEKYDDDALVRELECRTFFENRDGYHEDDIDSENLCKEAAKRIRSYSASFTKQYTVSNRLLQFVHEVNSSLDDLDAWLTLLDSADVTPNTGADHETE